MQRDCTPQTQPVPSPISYYLHQSPQLLHQLETLGNHMVELGVPFLLLLPRPLRLAGGLVQVLFQVYQTSHAHSDALCMYIFTQIYSSKILNL